MRKTRILFEGHDLKFLTHVIDHFKVNHDFHVDVLTYEGHVIKDFREIHRIFPEIDVIFCEWGLGNLQWFSHNKLPGQRLITRIHLQEFSTTYLGDTCWDNVDQAIVVGPYMKERFDRHFPGVSEKCTVIPNLIDTDSFDIPKIADARFNLGLLGILPSRKAPHLAVEILRELRKKDDRYRLFIKGRRAEEVEWVWNRPGEQEYYSALYESVKHDGLQDAVFFEPQGSDVQQWFSKIGFVVSPSEFESFHMAIAEGMASRAIPVIRNWAGSELLFPGRYSFSGVDEAVAMISKFNDQKLFTQQGETARNYCREHFDLRVILPKYDALMFPEIKPVEIRKAYFDLQQKHQKALSASEDQGKALLKRSEELSAVLQQQQMLAENNGLLAGELKHLSGQITAMTQQKNVLAESHAAVAGELKILGEEMSVLLKQKDVLTETNALLTSEMKGLRETIQQQVSLNQQQAEQRQQLEKELAEQRSADRQRLSEIQELAFSLRQLQDQNRREREESAKTAADLRQQVAGIEMQRKALDTERKDLQKKISNLMKINADLERRLILTFSSLSWKVGAILIKTPGDFLRAVKGWFMPSG